MIFGQQIHSMANPVQGSALFDFGFKEADAFVTFSVGTIAAGNGYLTPTSSGTLPTATIENGIITFSQPQTHSYVGVGDKVSFASGPDVYLNKKISTRQWYVKLADGTNPTDTATVEVNLINKVFSSLQAALDIATEDLATLYGTKDLTSRGRHVRLACYAKTDDLGSGGIGLTDWRTSPDTYLYIFAPSSIKYDCNSRQKFDVGETGGYRLASTGNIFRPLPITYGENYVALDGIIFDQKSGSNFGIDITFSAPGLRVLNSIFKDGAVGVYIGAGDSDVAVVNCKFSGMSSSGIDDTTSSVTKVYNSVFTDSTAGIDWTISSSNRYVNCIFKSAPAAGSVKTVLENCISDDTSVTGGINCFPSIAVKFLNETSNDYRLHPTDSTAYLNGQDLSADSFFPFNTDFLESPIDDSWCIGMSHYVPTVYLAIGDTTADYKTGTPNVAVTDSVATFDAAQTDSRLCAGCIVSTASGNFYLWRKITTSSWIVTDANGEDRADITSVAVTSIKPVFDDLYDALWDDGGGTSGVEDLLSLDLVTDDTSVVIACTEGAITRGAKMRSFTTDETRYIRVYTPFAVTIDCNARRRHSGLWDNSLFTTDGQTSFDTALEVTCDYTVVDGLQIEADTNAVKVSAGKNVHITNNIIKDCGSHAIEFDSNDPADQNVVANNLIYGISGHGIDIAHNFGNSAYGTEGTVAQNQWSLTASSTGHPPNAFQVKVESGASPQIIWTPRALVIVTDGRTPQSLLDNAVVTGSPWGVIVAISSTTNIATFPWQEFRDFDNFVAGTDGDTDSYFFLYNNTVFDCERGIYLESATFDTIAHTNVIAMKNNVVRQASVECYRSYATNPDTIYAEANIADDDSLERFSGPWNLNGTTIDFRNVARFDFHLTLYDSIRIQDVAILSCDPDYQITTDYEGENRNFGFKWDVSADNYSDPPGAIAEFSMGSTTGDLGGAGLTASIKNSILTFSGGAIDSRIGVGDKVAYGVGPAYCYLAERGSDTVWRVVDNYGSPVGPTASPASVSNIKRVFNALDTAIDGTPTGTALYTELGNLSDLVSLLISVDIWCYADGVDGGDVSIQGWTTSSDYRITILAPWDTNTQAITNQRHAGKWGAGFKIESDTTGDTIELDNAWVTIEGLMVKPNAVTDIAIHVRGARDGVVIRGNVVKDADIGIAQDSSLVEAHVIDNIVYDSVSGIVLDDGSCYNNTVADTTSVGISATADVRVKNCISQKVSGNDFSGAATLEYCISSDATAGVASGCRSNVTLQFADAANDDFHLHRSDWEALNRGTDLSADVDYWFNRDIDMEFIKGQWSIGADCQPDLDVIDVYLSVGKNTSDFKKGTSPTVLIGGGVAAFSDDQDRSNMGIGDKVDYDTDNKICYLYRKVALNEWEVRTEMGIAPPDSAEVDLNSITHTFNDLAVAVGTGASSVRELIGDSNNPFSYLDTARIRLHFPTYRDVSPHTSQVLVSGYDVASDRYIRLYTPTDILTECNTNQRHQGRYIAGSSQALLYTSAAFTQVVLSTIWYTRVDGFVINGYIQLNDGIEFDDCYECQATNNIIFACSYAIFTDPSGPSADPGETNYMVNNIIWDVYQAIHPGGYDVIFNNTMDECADHAVDNAATDTLTNNIAKDCVNGCYADNTTISACVSDDSTAGSDRFNISNSDIPFVDEGARNYFLAQAALDARGNGATLINNPNFAFSTDAADAIRGRRWDRGALEYVALKKVVYAVGKNGGADIRKGAGSSLGYEITIVSGKSIITFAEPQDQDAMGVGNEVLDNSLPFTSGCLIQEKITTSSWYVTDYQGDYFTIPKSGNASRIQRVFDDLWSAFGAYGIFSTYYLDSEDLATDTVQISVACYDDESFEIANAEIPELDCDPDYFLRIFSPIDITKECNKNQRHNGRPDTGFRMSLVFDLGDDSYCIKATNTDYLEIEGIGFRVNYLPGHGVWLENCKSILIKNNVFAACAGNGIQHDMVEDAIDVIVNNLIRASGFDAIDVGATTAANAYVAIYNNTIVNCRRGVHFRKGASGNVPTGLLKNNIVQQSSYQAYVEENPQYAGFFTLYGCISQDESASLFVGAFNQSRVTLIFADVGAGNYNLDSRYDHEAIDNGVDLSGDAVFAFDYDIVMRERLVDYWDIGAFEVVNVVAFETDLAMGPMEMAGTAIADELAYTTIIYLRETLWPQIDERVQFNIIGDGSTEGDWGDLPSFTKDINYFLKETPPVDNLIIYVQSNKKFTGTLQLQDRAPRNVIIATDPAELSDGPAALTYPWDPAAPIVDDASAQELLTFRNIKVYSEDETTGAGQDYFVNNAASTTAIRFENSIIQVNYDSIVGNNTGCTVESINTILVYRNKGVANTLYLTKNGENGNVVANSTILAYRDGALEFATSDATTITDEIHNCLTYNYGSGDLDISSTMPSSKVFESQENVDPKFEGATIPAAAFDISDTMDEAFKPRLDSPVVDAGDNAFVAGIVTDIVGNARIFDAWLVDIGPYELEVHKITFTTKNIQSIFQSKLKLDYENRQYVPETGDIVYRDLYGQFIDNPEDREEFVREAKIIIQLKSFTQDYRIRTDKRNDEVTSFEAYYDNGTMSTVMDKPRDLYGNMLSTMFDDGRFVFQFDEVQHRITVYLNTTYDKGLSGPRNVVNKVRFGGTAVVGG